jgi:protein involved in polysaccharide export with SLBB domain
MMRHCGCWLSMAVFCALAGCTSGGGGSSSAAKATPEESEGSMAQIDAWLQKQALDIPAAPYYVQTPDTIKLLCPSVKEIDGQEFVVRPDGKIYAPLVGEVQVANLTPVQISMVLEEKLKGFFTGTSLDVAVVVVEFKSKSIFVMGQVIKPGIKPYTGRNTVLGVLADARLNDRAWPQKIVVVRRNDNPDVKERITVDVKEMFEHGKVDKDYLLEAGDVVYVPLSPLAQAGLTFGKILYPVMPATHLMLMVYGF